MSKFKVGEVFEYKNNPGFVPDGTLFKVSKIENRFSSIHGIMIYSPKMSGSNARHIKKRTEFTLTQQYCFLCDNQKAYQPIITNREYYERLKEEAQ